MFSFRHNTPADAARVLDIWAGAVDATHDFLTPEDRQAICIEVAAFLPQARLTLIVSPPNRPGHGAAEAAPDTVHGFMLIDNDHLEALFIDPAHHRQGLGRAMIAHAHLLHPRLSVDVNAQNHTALRFYLAMGFSETGRSDLDHQGRAYPLIHLRL